MDSPSPFRNNGRLESANAVICRQRVFFMKM